ncbi:hypothetical protein FE783_35980 [Paenibacillus mesophilus]|uniref:hypothetical protein n=1 Tax=Paenibacillus mesophilus TaxID=2582849 RepID=UPI00110E0930|nr:hypothetical protein [Paenibacillus mesophilus]TMV43177.1 hypothetical protein FE783_35980 [Paenibacillus mesophilus]
MITKGVSIPPIRGNIYDSVIQQIAYSISTQSLYFTFKTGFKQEAAEALDAKLVQLFNEKGEANSKPLTTEEVIEAMDIKGRTYLPFQQRRIKSGLSKEEIAYLSEHRDEYPDMDVGRQELDPFAEIKWRRSAKHSCCAAYLGGLEAFPKILEVVFLWAMLLSSCHLCCYVLVIMSRDKNIYTLPNRYNLFT